MYQNIFFDLDGTLVNTEEGILNGIEYARKTCNLPILPYPVVKRFIGPPLPLSFRTFYELDDDGARQAVTAYRSYYNEKGKFECRLYHGIRQLLKRLQERGCRLFVATSKPTPYAVDILRHLEIEGRFQRIQGSDLNNLSSYEKADIIRKILAEEKLDKKETLMVGDTKFDMEGAQKAGIDFLGVLYGFGDREELSGHSTLGPATTPRDIETILFG